LPLAIYTALQSPGGDVAAARLSAISILLALSFLTLAELAARRARAAA
jgi:molybdate transport system permease protein